MRKKKIEPSLEEQWKAKDAEAKIVPIDNDQKIIELLTTITDQNEKIIEHLYKLRERFV